MPPTNVLTPLLTKLLTSKPLPKPDPSRPVFALLMVGGEVVDEELPQLTATCAYLVDGALGGAGRRASLVGLTRPQSGSSRPWCTAAGRR